MKFGAMNFPIRPLADEIESFAALGFDYLELAMDPPMAHYSVIRDQKQAVMRRLQAAGMALVCHLPTFVYTADLTDSIREASRREMLHSLETAAELGALKVVIHPSVVSGMGAFVLETALALAMESLEILALRAASLGIRLCLENMFPRYRLFTEPDAFTDVFSCFPDLELTLDTGHANIGGGGNQRLMNFITTWGHRIGHVHISDNRGTSDDHFPLGGGTIDFKGFAGALKAAGYGETATLEIFSDDRGDLVRSREAFRALWG